MRNRILFTCLLALLSAPCVHADDSSFSGGIFLGGRAISLDRQSANFNQYNGIVPGLFGGGDLSYDKDKYYLDVDAAYLGPDDLYLNLKGGKWGSFKYSLFFTEWPHNLSFGNRTIFTNPGSQTLTLPGTPSSNSDLWPSTSFDYKIRRKNVGGSLDVTALSPFFFSITSNHLERDGVVPWSGHSLYGFSNTVELPLSVDDRTTNANALMGWRNKRFYVALGATFSEYGNSAEFVRFRDAYATSAPIFGTIVGPPDNKSWMVDFTGTAKQLPFSSVFTLNASYQENTSSTSFRNSVETGTLASPTVTSLASSGSSFDGKVKYMNLGANLASTPINGMNTKLYFKYFDRRNDSGSVTFFNPSSPSSGTVVSDIFGYDKTSVGTEVSYRFLKNLKGIAGYDFTGTRRKGQDVFVQDLPGIADVRNTQDNTFKGELIYNPFDWLGARLKYQKLFRKTNTVVEPGTLNTTVITNNATRFDVGNKKRDVWRFATDLTPLEGLDISLEYAYKLDDYDGTVLGFTSTEENEFILDGSYTWKKIKLFAFFDYDVSYTKQTERYLANTTSSGDPAASPTATAFNWDAYLRNNNYAFGFGTALPIIEGKVAFRFQWDFEKNAGYADFTSQAFTAAQAASISNNNIDISPWNDYTRQNISATVSWTYDRNVTFLFGYLYSQFRLDDGGLNGYQYVATATPVYLTGAYADQNYRASLYFIKAMYRF